MSYSVFLDLDGTLIAPEEDTISQRTVDALKQAQNNGHKIFLNTGRSLAELKIDAFRGFRFDGYLCGCSYITAGGRILMADRLTADELQPITAHFYGRDIPVVLEGEDAVYAVYTDETNAEEQGMIPLTDMSEVFRICELEPITKMSIFANLGKEDLEFIRSLADPIERNDTICTEVVPKGHDKAYVMNKTVEYLNLDPTTVIAIGDSSNDFAMLDAAPISVAMGNAADEVKSRTTYTTVPVTEDGVAVFLEKFLK